MLTEFERQSEISAASASTDIPGKEVGNSTGFWKKGTTNEKRARTLGVDTKFIDNYGLKIIAGRAFGDDFGTEQTNVILNETAARVFGFETPESAVGQQITYSDGDLTVVGILKDYHQQSLRDDYDPIVFYANTGSWSYYSLKVTTSDMQKNAGKR
ncbi:MAG: ABC transporter permease [Saprospiraceae bacterium]|nr:ABC transporter permease [Saprospiraceae bacterium]